MPVSGTPASNEAPGVLRSRHWRAPRIDGAAVIEPPPTDWAATHFDTVATAAAAVDVQGWPFDKWRTQLRRESVAAAQDYTTNVLRVSSPSVSPEGPLLVGGHQPELFHAGVWAKNFALAAWARQAGGMPLQLIVDQDVLHESAVRVPVGTRSTPRLESLAYDAPQVGRPWEAAQIVDPALWDSFPARLRTLLQSWGIEPLGAAVWSSLPKDEVAPRLVPRLTRMRAGIEREWGAGSLELPVSLWSTQPAVVWWMAHLLAHHRRIFEIYNATVQEYRSINRIRSRAHPVPDLIETEGWTEVPFWGWQTTSARRERLFVRQIGDELALRTATADIGSLPLTSESSAAAATDQLLALAKSGWHLRPRALTMTWLARMGLADGFIHGLGGAKYDEMTDALIGRFWGCPAPAFVTVSATLHLPLGGAWPETIESVGRLRQQQWQWQHQPESCPAVHHDPVAQSDVDELKALRSAPLAATAAERRTRYQRIRAVRDSLRLRVVEALIVQEQAVAAATARLQANQVLTRRDYSWILFPAERLRSGYDTLFPQLSR